MKWAHQQSRVEGICPKTTSSKSAGPIMMTGTYLIRTRAKYDVEAPVPTNYEIIILAVIQFDLLKSKPVWFFSRGNSWNNIQSPQSLHLRSFYTFKFFLLFHVSNYLSFLLSLSVSTSILIILTWIFVFKSCKHIVFWLSGLKKWLKMFTESIQHARQHQR